MPYPDIVRSSEPYSDFGNLSGRGARRLLGAPAADPLLTAVRESVQNSWDARIQGELLTYQINVRYLSQVEIGFLKDVVFRDFSGDPQSELKSVLELSSLRVLEVSDFGTTGLCGETRASRMLEGEKSKFVSFLRNIGAPSEDISGSGGTYGYGKSSLFNLSRCQTVLIDSLAENFDGSRERRFMASRMGEEFYSSMDRTSYTGRHWWGRRAEDGLVDPVVGVDAERVALGLGMPDRKHCSGTTIMILSPEFGEGVTSIDEISCHIRKTLLWYFWPKMVPLEGAIAPPMFFELIVDGEPIEIPDPRKTQPFTLFTKAIMAARAGGEKSHEIVKKRPWRHLGWMGDHRGPVNSAPSWLHDESLPGPLIPSPCHHVALMRSPELVVKYLIGNPLPHEDFGWAAAFISSPEKVVETAFALSEPATHDEWNPESLPDAQDRSHVKIALDRIKERMKEISPSAPKTSGTESVGLAGAADALGHMLMPFGGDRPVLSHREGGGERRNSKQRGVRVTSPEYENLTMVGSRKAAIFRFSLLGNDGVSAIISAAAFVIGEGGERVDSAPDGMSPEVIHWTFGGQVYEGDSQIRVTLGEDFRYGELTVFVPEDVAVAISLAVEEVTNE